MQTNKLLNLFRTKGIQFIAIVIVSSAALFLFYRNTLWYTSNALILRGDRGSELNVLTNLVEFSKYQSPFQNYLLPTCRQNWTGDGFFTKFIYTHYPPLAELIYYALGKLGVSTIHGLRVFPILLNIAALILFYFALKLRQDKLFAIIGLIVVCLQPVFYEGADGLHEFGLQFPQQALLLFGLSLIFRDKIVLGACLSWFAAFWQGLFSFEFQLLTLGIIAGFWLSMPDYKKKWPMFLLIASGGPLAFGLHFLQNSLYFGSLSEAFRDLFNTALYRSMNINGPKEHLQPSGFAYWHLMYKYYREYYSETLGLPILTACAVTLFNKERPRNYFRFFSCLFVGSLGWFVIMRQITYLQPHIMHRILLLIMTLSYTIITYAVLRWLSKSHETVASAINPILILALIVGWLWQPFIFNMKIYYTKEKYLGLFKPYKTAGLIPDIWAVDASQGLTGEWPGLIHGQIEPKMRYERTRCETNKPNSNSCNDPVQHLWLAFARPVTANVLFVRITGDPNNPLTIRFHQLHEDTRQLIESMGQANHPAAEDIYMIPFPHPVTGRLFDVQIETPSPTYYRIEYLILQ